MAESDGSENSLVIVDFSDQIDADLYEGAWRYQPGCGIAIDTCKANRLSDIVKLSAQGHGHYDSVNAVAQRIVLTIFDASFSIAFDFPIYLIVSLEHRRNCCRFQHTSVPSMFKVSTHV